MIIVDADTPILTQIYRLAKPLADEFGRLARTSQQILCAIHELAAFA
jgi:hypothetical protein